MSRLITHIGIVLCLISIILSSLLLFTPSARAAETQGGFVPLADVTGTKLEGLYAEGAALDGDFSGSLTDYINRIFMAAITIGGILAVMRIAWSGFLYITTDLWSTKGRAKEILQETILGLCLLLAVWLILYQINPNILSLKFNFTTPPGKETGTGLHQEGGVYNFVQAKSLPSGWYCFMVANVDDRYMCYRGASVCNEAAGVSCTASSDLTEPPLPSFVGLGNIPNGSYCYLSDTSDTYYCAASRDECNRSVSTYGDFVCDDQPYILPSAYVYGQFPSGYSCFRNQNKTGEYYCYETLNRCNEFAYKFYPDDRGITTTRCTIKNWPTESDIVQKDNWDQCISALTDNPAGPRACIAEQFMFTDDQLLQRGICGDITGEVTFHQCGFTTVEECRQSLGVPAKCAVY